MKYGKINRLSITETPKEIKMNINEISHHGRTIGYALAGAGALFIGSSILGRTISVAIENFTGFNFSRFNQMAAISIAFTGVFCFFAIDLSYFLLQIAYNNYHKKNIPSFRAYTWRHFPVSLDYRSNNWVPDGLIYKKVNK